MNSIDLLSTIENEDGTLDLTFAMDIETLKVFARIGILKVLTDAANDTIMNHSISEESNEG